MKEKVHVRVRLPLADCQYDVRLPADSQVEALTQTLVSMLQKHNTAPLLLQQKPTLCSAKTGEKLNAELTLREQGIKNSDLLLLI